MPELLNWLLRLPCESIAGCFNLAWVGEENRDIARQTQSGLVLALGEKIFRNGELAPMQTLFSEMKKAVPHNERLDNLLPKDGQLLDNGWFCQAYVDWQALVVFGVCLDHVSHSPAAVLSTEHRVLIMEYIRNKEKTSSRVKMLLKGVTKLGSGGNYVKAISELLLDVEEKQKACAALATDYEDKANMLMETIEDLLGEDLLGKTLEFEELYRNLWQVTQEHDEQVLELATVCHGLRGDNKGLSNEYKPILDAGNLVGEKLMEATEKLLHGVRQKRRIASFIILLSQNCNSSTNYVAP